MTEDYRYENVDQETDQCPRYANQGCFKSEFLKGTTQVYENQFHKGCSVFSIDKENLTCNKFGDIGSNCKGELHLKVTRLTEYFRTV